MKYKTGVYKIICTSNDKIYIGSSKKIEFRWDRHLMFLRNNKHVNCHMQNAFNKYGKDSFVLEIIEECDIEQLVNLENFWIRVTNCLDKKIGFNKRDGACGGTTISGEDHYLYGKYLSDETKRKISISRKGKTAKDNHPLRKLTFDVVKRMRELSIAGFSNKELTKSYNVSYSQVCRIIANKSWRV